MPDLEIKTFSLGDWATNCYVLHRSSPQPAGPCWIVDAGYEPAPLLAYIRAHKLVPEQILLTHAHLDHIAGLPDVRAAYPDIPILLHKLEHRFLTDPVLNLSAFLDQPLTVPQATGVLDHGQRLTLDGFTFEVRHTPGHSPGGITLYQPQAAVALVGDTLFQNSIGRFDFPTSNGQTLLDSIRSQLLTLPDDTRVLPGHGPATTISKEKRANPYLTGRFNLRTPDF